MPEIDLHAVAARLRTILAVHAAHERESIAIAASNVGVSAETILDAIDTTDPRPTLRLLFAVVRHYAVDPTWLLTGVYDHRHHLAALESDDEQLRRSIRALLESY